jgi:hypothetical protein
VVWEPVYAFLVLLGLLPVVTVVSHVKRANILPLVEPPYVPLVVLVISMLMRLVVSNVKLARSTLQAALYVPHAAKERMHRRIKHVASLVV